MSHSQATHTQTNWTLLQEKERTGLSLPPTTDYTALLNHQHFCNRNDSTQQDLTKSKPMIEPTMQTRLERNTAMQSFRKLMSIHFFMSLVVTCLLSTTFYCSSLSAQEKNAEEKNDVKKNADNTTLADTETDAKAQPPKIPSSPAEVVQQLGWYTIAPFFLASVIALWFAIERLVVLRKGRVIPRPFVERFLQHLQHGKLTPDNALALCHENGSPVAEVFAHGIRKWGKPSVEVEQAIIDGGERQVSQLRKHLRIINGVATVTPLMGLLGTVVGMIAAFNQIGSSNALGNTSELAVGIAFALLTTAAGLAIAIPALILYMYLAGRVDALVMAMDLHAQEVVHYISAESLAVRKVKKETKPRPRQPAKTS